MLDVKRDVRIFGQERVSYLGVSVRQSPSSLAATNGEIRRLALTESGQPVADHYTRDARDSRRNQAETKSSNFPLNSRAQISDGSGGRFRTVPEIIQSVRSMHYGHIEQERWSGDVLGGSEAVSAALLVARPSARVTAYACYVVAGMFVVFAVWAAPGFALPEEPRPLALAEFSSSSSSLRADFRPSCPRPGTGRFDGYLADWHWRCGCQP